MARVRCCDRSTRESLRPGDQLPRVGPSRRSGGDLAARAHLRQPQLGAGRSGPGSAVPRHRSGRARSRRQRLGRGLLVLGPAGRRLHRDGRRSACWPPPWSAIRWAASPRICWPLPIRIGSELSSWRTCRRRRRRIRRARSRRVRSRGRRPTGARCTRSSPGATVPTRTWDDYADRIGCRTLVVGGVRSHLPQVRLRKLAKRIARGSYVVLDTGHDVHGERPGEFLAVVQPFLDEAIR